MLERELKAMKEGKRRGEGPNGLQAMQEFEQMLLGIPFDEAKVIDPEKAERDRLKREGKLKKEAGSLGMVLGDKATNFVQNKKRDINLDHAEKHLINL